MDWREQVLQAHEMNHRPHFKIYAGVSAKSTPTFESDETSTYDQAHQKLLASLNLLVTPGKYLAQFKDTFTGNNGNVNYPFEIPYYYGNQQQQQGNNAIGGARFMNGMSEDQFESKLEKRLAEKQQAWQAQQEVVRLTEKMAKLTKKLKKAKKAANPIAEGLKMFEPHLPVIMGALSSKFGWNAAPATIGVTGVTADPVPPQQEPAVEYTPEEVAEIRQKLDETMTWLIEQEGGQKEAVDFLYKLYLKGKASPHLLNTLKSLL